ncbi:hypothetical protein SDJN02_01170, partial [Cucurbita argyrosperma subsp. argyrosperma]
MELLRSSGSGISAMATSDSKPDDRSISSPETELLPESESQLSVLVYDMEKCRRSALDRKGVLEEEKQQFQQAAYTVLDLLNNGGGTL